VFANILAGSAVSEITPELHRLSVADQQAVLCTICAMHIEIGSNCVAVAERISELLTAECREYVNGRATCAE